MTWGGGSVENIDMEQFRQRVRGEVLIKAAKKRVLYDAVVARAREVEQQLRAEQEKALEVTDEQETPAE